MCKHARIKHSTTDTQNIHPSHSPQSFLLELFSSPSAWTKTHGSQHLARKHPWVFTIKLLKNAQIYIFYKNIYTHTHIKTERWIIIKRTWIIWNYYVSETSRKWIQEYISLQTKKCVPLNNYNKNMHVLMIKVCTLDKEN